MIKPLKCKVCGKLFLCEMCYKCNSYKDNTCQCDDCGIFKGKPCKGCGSEIKIQKAFMFR
jgi:hypothetical protein